MNADDVMVTMSVRDLRGALRAAARNGISRIRRRVVLTMRNIRTGLGSI